MKETKQERYRKKLQEAARENPLLKADIEKLKTENESLRKQLNPSFHELMLREDEKTPYAWLKSLPDTPESVRQIETALSFERIPYELLEMCSSERSALRIPVVEHWHDADLTVELRKKTEENAAAIRKSLVLKEKREQLERDIEDSQKQLADIKEHLAKENSKSDLLARKTKAVKNLTVFYEKVIEIMQQKWPEQYHRMEENGAFELVAEDEQILGVDREGKYGGGKKEKTPS